MAIEIFRQFTKLVAPAARPVAGHHWFTLWAVLHHRGRRTGRPLSVVVVARPTATGFVMPLPFDGAQWVRNVLAAGGGQLTWNGAVYELRAPRVATGPEPMAAFNGVLRFLLGVTGINRFLVVDRVEGGDAS